MTLSQLAPLAILIFYIYLCRVNVKSGKIWLLATTIKNAKTALYQGFKHRHRDGATWRSPFFVV